MATKSVPVRGPAAMTEGYSMRGSQANRVALKPGASFRGGNRFSVAGPVCGGLAVPRETTQARAAQQTAAGSVQRGADLMGTPWVRIRQLGERPLVWDSAPRYTARHGLGSHPPEIGGWGFGAMAKCEQGYLC